MNFEFAAPQRIIFGPGTIASVGEIVRGFGSHALVVTGSNPSRSARLMEILAGQGISVVPFQVPGEPTLELVEAGIALARSSRCEFVISFGGGSVIDAGKAIAAMIANGGALMDHLEVIGRGQPLLRPSAPFVAIPTTAGAGAEATRNAVLASPGHKVKASLRSVHMLPAVALIDPGLTLELPPAITAATGMDALTQLIEPFTCTRANPITDALCRDGIRRAARSLRSVVASGHDVSARTDMAHAALNGGLALANAGLGAAHGFAAPIGGMFNAPHGAVCAALLPHVMKMNIGVLRSQPGGEKFLARYDEIARIVTGNLSAGADDGARWVDELASDLKIPRLGMHGINAAHVGELVAKAKNASSMKANPVALNDGQLSEVLEAAL